ncbi:RagB/SusD family nutrient uptake outer membrane protein [Parapedobacter sp. DT-150]|uniref:RagB/SusD family nutrient uptake outer membrane protein n=1 Tax=Parapedobacter sp. DT-150 TaxID=3396162 RepID=UPI003F1AFE68
MKINLNIPMIFCMAALVSSCSLITEPVDTYSDVTEGANNAGQEVVFKDKAAVESHMQTIYRQLNDRQEHWYLDLLLIAESHADNAYGGTTGAEVIPFENNALDASNSVLSRDWTRYLEDVARANRLLVNIDSVQDASLTDTERLRYKAEAKIFRALVYFDMVRIWGDVPLITTEAPDITAENIEDVYDLYFPAQSPEVDVYRQIERDLLEALPDAPDVSPSNKTLLSKSVARAMLAKVYAEKPIRDYTKVVQYADELAADGFDLVADLSDLFGTNAANSDTKMRNTVESILEAQFFPGSGNWVTWMFGRDLSNYNNSFTWAKWVTPSRDLIRAYQQEGDQKRYEQAIVYYETSWSNYYPADNYAFMYKIRSAHNSIIKLRYADILLLKAEALVVNNDLEGAATIIDRIRQRAGLGRLPSAVRSNQTAMLDALLKERRLELAFEGQRWFDLVRLDKVAPVMNAVYANDEGRLSQVYPFNETSHRLPIPQSAIDQNPKLVQNPGY